MNYNTDENVLQDVSAGGKKRDWKGKKERNLLLADSYERIGYFRYADRCRECAFFLSFFKTDEGLTFNDGLFCQLRLCPMCAWRKSLKAFSNVSKIMNYVQREDADLVPLFLTLTVRNCKADELEVTIKHILKSWRVLANHRTFVDQIQGWLRALEVTYNRKADTYHPHIHVILMVKKEYFSKSNEKYITTEKWVHLWRTSAKLDYDPVCDIRKVRKTKKNISKTVAEIAKYTVKDSDYIGNDEVIKTLTDAIFRKRLYAYGGVIAKASKALKIRKPDSGDLVHIDNDAIRDDVAYVIVKYGWSFGVGDYLRM